MLSDNSKGNLYILLTAVFAFIENRSLCFGGSIDSYDCSCIKYYNRKRQVRGMKYELVIFDLDGTILDTLDDLADSTNMALQMNGLPMRTREEVRAFVGNGIQNLIERAVPLGVSTGVVQKVLKDFKVYYGEHCADKTKPYDGMIDLILQLRAQGFKTAVVSNKADFAVQELCEQYFPNMFDYVVGERVGVRKKPEPDSVNEVLHMLGIDRKCAVYVGDSEVDIATVQNAKMECIIVDWGFRDREYLLECGAKLFASTIEELSMRVKTDE